MKLDEIEKQFKDSMLGAETDALESKQLQESKNKVWGQVNSRLKRKTPKISVYWMAAASVIIVLLAVFGLRQLQHKTNQIAMLRSEIQNMKEQNHELASNFMQTEEQLNFERNKPPRVDTVFKTKIVYQQIEPSVVEHVAGKVGEVDFATENNRQVLLLGKEKLDMASIKNGVESFKIQYGQKSKDGATPWTFTVTYQ